jgi:hypothetical protein
MLKTTLNDIKGEFQTLSASVEAINGRVNILSGVKEIQDGVSSSLDVTGSSGAAVKVQGHDQTHSAPENVAEHEPAPERARQPSITSRIVLTTYPGQSGVDPLPMDWGNKSPELRGPVTVSRNQSTFRRRNGQYRRSSW